MGRCRNSVETKQSRRDSSLAKALAPEEIRRGDFVTPLYVVSEWPSWFWHDNDPLRTREEPVRICNTPRTEPQPLKVRSVCLPFVLVRSPDGHDRTLDVRKHRLARLSRKFAETAWRAYRKPRKSQVDLLSLLC